MVWFLQCPISNYCCLQVRDITNLPFAERELMLIKIAVNATARRDVLDIANIFRAKAVDVSDHTVTLEVIFIIPTAISIQVLFYCISWPYMLMPSSIWRENVRFFLLRKSCTEDLASCMLIRIEWRGGVVDSLH